MDIPVDRDEVDRLRKRFMKLDKVCFDGAHLCHRLLLYVSGSSC